MLSFKPAFLLFFLLIKRLFSSSSLSVIQFTHSVVSDLLWPHEPQHSRPPCPSPTPRVYPNSCPLGQWCHPTISFSVIPFPSCPQSFPALGSFQMRPSPTPRVYQNSCPLSRWYHPSISSSVIPFSSCPKSLPALGSFQMSQFFASGGQSIGVLATTSVLPMNTQDWSPLGWTGWISLQSKGLSRVFANITVQNHQFFGAQLSSQSNSPIHTWPLEKP